ncbi:MAG: 50S ribosomal protein L4 [Crenarchaeota archaeon]|nr:50S ribosomal protein L4 [Thermoproteota archaeon]
MTVRIVATYLRPEPVTAPVYDLEAKPVDKIVLPLVFRLPIRVDLIRRAFHSAHTARLQPKGRDPLAGKRRCGEYWGIGYGVARLPRLPDGRAVFSPNTVGGRRQFAPSPLKKLHEEINRREMQLAIASALAATAHPDFVKKRGHVVPSTIEALPIVAVDALEDLSRAKDVKNWLKKMGLWNDVERAQRRIRIRSGKGKMRGRRYTNPKSLLFIISSLRSPIVNAVSNLPGVDFLTPNSLNIMKLAPGATPGRLTIITTRALEELKSLFEVVTA